MSNLIPKTTKKLELNQIRGLICKGAKDVVFREISEKMMEKPLK